MAKKKKEVTLNVTQQVFTFFPSTLTPENNKPILIAFRKKGGRKRILTQGVYRHLEWQSGEYVSHKEVSKKWLAFNLSLLHETWFVDGEEKKVKNDYVILEWAYIK